jgi:hypothetical protein
VHQLFLSAKNDPFSGPADSEDDLIDKSVRACGNATTTPATVEAFSSRAITASKNSFGLFRSPLSSSCSIDLPSRFASRALTRVESDVFGSSRPSSNAGIIGRFRFATKESGPVRTDPNLASSSYLRQQRGWRCLPERQAEFRNSVS